MKLKIAAGAAFLCSLIFCSGIMCSYTVDEEESEDAYVMKTAEEEKQLPVIVIDPGHGGFDGGAEGADGTKEKDINLAIGLKLKEVAEEYPVEVVMTRDGDEALLSEDSGGKKRQDLTNRKNIIEETAPVVTISIHLNSFPQDESVYGAQVFYPKTAETRTSGEGGEQNSGGFAESVQNSLEKGIDDGRQREAMAKNDILLFKAPTHPIILVECGFLSNAKERDKLKSAEYQELLACCIWDGVNEKLCLEKDKQMDILDSANKS